MNSLAKIALKIFFSAALRVFSALALGNHG